MATKEDIARLASFSADRSTAMLLHEKTFPPSAFVKWKFLRGRARREIGHGALAPRALVNLLPPKRSLRMRLVSDILDPMVPLPWPHVCGGLSP